MLVSLSGICGCTKLTKRPSIMLTALGRRIGIGLKTQGVGFAVSSFADVCGVGISSRLETSSIMIWGSMGLKLVSESQTDRVSDSVSGSGVWENGKLRL